MSMTMMMMDLRQRSSLVGEDVLDLAEFFIERRSPRPGCCVFGLVVHVLVPVDPQTVYEPDHLHGCISTDS